MSKKFFLVSLSLGALLLSACNKEDLVSLDEGQFASPPQTVSIAIMNYAPAPGKAFHDFFVSNFSVKASRAKLLLSSARDGIPDTLKTQFLFRINKGIEAVNESINEHMPESERPIPFPNIVYVGDGMTDVPSMALTKKNGGHAVAVFDPHGERGHATCVKLLEAGRVDLIAQADFRKASKLSRRVELLLDAIIADIAYRREAFACRVENRPARRSPRAA